MSCWGHSGDSVVPGAQARLRPQTTSGQPPNIISQVGRARGTWSFPLHRKAEATRSFQPSHLKVTQDDLSPVL